MLYSAFEVFVIYEQKLKQTVSVSLKSSFSAAVLALVSLKPVDLLQHYLKYGLGIILSRFSKGLVCMS